MSEQPWITFPLCLTRGEIKTLSTAMVHIGFFESIQRWHADPEIWKAINSISEFAIAAHDSNPSTRRKRLTHQVTFSVTLLRWEVKTLQTHVMAAVECSLENLACANFGLVAGKELAGLLQRITIIAGAATEGQEVLATL